MMKKIVILLAVMLAVGVCPAFADTAAREGMIAYSGSEAFTRLSPEEREACTSWLVYGGEMSAECKRATMKLISEAPEAVTAEQRQALTAEASGNVTTVKAPEPVKQETTTIKKSDNTGKYVAIGLLGVLAGLVIHNNVGHKHKAAPSEPAYRPEPPRPVNDRRPPERRPAPQQPQPRPIDKRPPRR